MNRRDAIRTIGLGTASLFARTAIPEAFAAPITREAARRHFSGVVIFPMTPMVLRGGRAEVDFDGFARNMRFYVSHQGAYSFAVCGAVGEYHDLTPDEREKMISIAAAAKGSRFLIAGAGGDTTRDAIANAQAAEKAGADAAVILPSEAIGKGGDKMMLSHFVEIARAVGIGVVPYRSPLTLFSLDTAQRLLEQSNILAIKEQTGDLRFIRDAHVKTSGQIPLVPAHERLAPFNYLAGASGFTSGQANFAASRSIELWQLLQNGQTKEGMLLADQFAELDRLRATYGDVLLKAGLEVRGLAGGPLRKNPASLPPEGRASLERAMRAMGVLEPASPSA
jgi:dihydrodipicolinate synthase/N-acetylneuraminate lyase